jgi:hypothetical protein
VVAAFAKRLRVPAPPLLVAVGLVVALMPGAPNRRTNPSMIVVRTGVTGPAIAHDHVEAAVDWALPVS